MQDSRTKKVNLLILIVVIAVLASMYLIIVTSFFHGLLHAKLFDDIPDLLIFMNAFILYIYALQLKKPEIQKYLSQGAFMIAIHRLIQIPMQEYQNMDGVIHPIYWILTGPIYFLGLLLILIAFKKRYD